MSRMLLTLLARLRQAAPASADQVSDGKLLSRFVRSQDAAAFELLFWRHGPMVWNVCRRLLGDSADAEDAFQAAFVVLARKADTIVHGEALAGFLHRVAWRVALNARTARQRRSAHEQAVPRPADLPDRDDPVGRTMDAEMKELLDQELQRLPEKFRAALVLCYLQGKTRDEAAEELGWKPSVLKGRLELGRKMLHQRLARRGVALSTALLIAGIGQTVSASVPSSLVVTIVSSSLEVAAGKALAGVVSQQVASLAQAFLRTTFLQQLHAGGVLLLAVCLAGGGWAGHRALSPRAGTEPAAERAASLPEVTVQATIPPPEVSPPVLEKPQTSQPSQKEPTRISTKKREREREDDDDDRKLRRAGGRRSEDDDDRSPSLRPPGKKKGDGRRDD